MVRPLADILAVFEEIAPLYLAEDWDNVGLLLSPAETAKIQHILLTVDLTEPVLAEAIAEHAEFILAYHPPLFKGLRRLTRRTAAERIVMDALRAGIFVYSPHTALDAAPGGINEWLGALLGPGQGRPILANPSVEGVGAGRIVDLDAPITLDEALPLIKSGLGLSHVRVAASARHRQGEEIRSLAVCAGAGGAVFERLLHADLLLTGEMRHHAILAAVADGMSVVVTDHTNTERGYLPLLARVLQQRLDRLKVTISRHDSDPLAVS